MINILIGVLATVLLFCLLYAAYEIGRKQRKIDTATKLSKEEEKAERLRIEGMENVLNFDYDVAIGKRVNR